MAGYTRQSAADIVTGAVVLAAPINAEYNAIQTAFHATTGHTHDASSGNGPKITLTTSVSGILPPANGGVGAALTVTVDNTIPRFNGTGGIMQTSSAVIDDDGGLSLTSTDAGAAAAPKLDLIRDSASPAAADNIGHIRFIGEDSTSTSTNYADIFATIVDTTDTSEDGTLTFRIMVAGTNTNRIVANAAGIILSGTTTVSGLINNTNTADDTADYNIGSFILCGSSTDKDINSTITPRAMDEGSNGTYKFFADGIPGSGTWTTVPLTGTWRVRGRVHETPDSGSGFTYTYLCERTA